MLYGLPCGLDKIDDLRCLADHLSQRGAVLRLMIDHPGQVHALANVSLASGKPWSIFIKVDGGGK
jgi:D-serine deaminase-like pyridoxal phosphate-dependent protein